MGQIKKLENDKYLVDIYDKNNNRIRKRFEKKSDANAFIAMIDKEKYEQKLFLAGMRPEQISIHEAIQEFMEEKQRLGENTKKKYKNTFHQFEQFVSGLKITNISEYSRSHADQFKEKLLQTDAAPKTINHYLTQVKSLFNRQVERDRIIKSPFQHVELVREKKKTLLEKEEEYYKIPEIKKFFEQDINAVYRHAFMGLYLTGCRFGELASLRWDTNIDWERKMFLIRTTDEFETKNASSERDIPITKNMFKKLEELKDKVDSDYIFPSIKGKQLSERTLLTKCKNIAKTAVITKNATLHKWRHTFASMTEKIGISYDTRQHLLGHSPGSMTQHYTKIDVSELHEKLSELENLIE